MVEFCLSVADSGLLSLEVVCREGEDPRAGPIGWRALSRKIGVLCGSARAHGDDRFKERTAAAYL